MFKFYRKSIFPLILIFGFAILFYPRAAEINTIDLTNTVKQVHVAMQFTPKTVIFYTQIR